MSATFMMAALLAAGAPAAADSVDVAYDALSQGRTDAAIAQLEPVESSDPAAMINLAAAYAAHGRVAEARTLYEKAAYADRYELETSSGDWVDSRVLARQGLAQMDKFAIDTRMASAGD